MHRSVALLPALLLALFAFWCGTFPGAAGFPAGVTGQALLLVVALLGARAWRDPLGLGGSGRLLVWALLASVAASVAASPVPRAGRVGLALLPAFLLLVPALARAFAGGERERRLAVAGWAAVLAAVAVTALGVQLATGAERAAMPLGHHNLLAALLVTALPVAAVGLRGPGVERWLAGAAVTLAAGALLASRSASGLAALAVVGLAGGRWLGRSRRLLLGLALLGLAALVPRAEAVLRGRDSSVAARAVYARGGLAGVAARPLLGWGPGATPWTLAPLVVPRPGLNPAGEAVGELHSLPLQLAYELGLPGALLALTAAGLFALRRRRELADARDRDLAAAGLLGLAAGGIASLGAAFLVVPALPVALAGSAAAALGGASFAAPRGRSAPALLYALAAVAALAGPALGSRAYERGRGGGRAAAAAALDAAMRHDPGFPLYAARRAWLGSEPAATRLALAAAAAARAPGVAALWLRAGGLAVEAGELERARELFGRAMACDPLNGMAPYLRFLASGGRELDCAARALAAEPRLAAAVQWRSAEPTRRAALARLRDWPGLPAGFALELERRALAAAPGGGEEVDLGLRLDVTPALAISLHQFRRSPWPADVARVRLERAAVRALLDLDSAARRTDASPAAFPRDRCAPAAGG